MASLFEQTSDGSLVKTCTYFNLPYFEQNREHYERSEPLKEQYSPGEHIVGRVFAEGRTVNVIDFKEYGEFYKRPEE
jgi:hypothetical protein